MKRTPLKRKTALKAKSWGIKTIGKRGKANRKSRNMISQIAAQNNLYTCEAKLDGCMGTFGIAPAHRHKRDHYNGDAEKLADPQEWVAACQWCHDIMEKSKEKTEEVFERLRPSF